MPSRRHSFLYFAFADQSVSTPLAASPLRFYACLCRCFAALPESSPCHRQAILNFALPQLCFLSPRHAFASQFHLYFAIPLQAYAFCTLPWPFFAPRHLSLPLPCNAKPLRRMLRCSASFWSSKCGPCVPVPPRPGVAASERRCRRC